MIRLFVALKIPDEIREEIINLRNKVFPDADKYKWEPKHKIHLTLKFIGGVDESLVDKISGSLDFIQNYNKISCKLTKFGFFFKNKEPRILWAGLFVDNSLFKLIDEINKNLEQYSIPSEQRKFKAHLTLKRFKGWEGKDFVKKFEDFKIPEIEFKSDEISLVKSELLPKGSVYSDIKIYKLK